MPLERHHEPAQRPKAFPGHTPYGSATPASEAVGGSQRHSRVTETLPAKSDLAVRPTPELHRHHEITTPERDRDNNYDRPSRIETQTQLDRYLRRKSITEDMHESGCRYFADAYYSGAVPHGSSCVGERLDRSPEAFSDRFVAATQRRRHAIRALGLGLVPITEWVCCDDRAAEGYAIRRREHPRAGPAYCRFRRLAWDRG